jgi:hypothetical protein
MNSRRILAGFAAALSLTLAGCGSTGGTSGTASKPTDAELLAQIEKGEAVSADDAMVQKFDGLLAGLQRTCRVRSGDASLADNVVNSREYLVKYGIHESLESILEHVSESHLSRKVGVSCTELFALYIDLRRHE